MIVELAISTGTPPAAWWDEPPEVLVTAAAVLRDRARAATQPGRRR